MEIRNARKIISDNYNCNKNSFIYFLHEECYFSIEKFWEYYESITVFVGGMEKNPETTKQIVHSYQRILKEIIFHFDPMDAAVIDNFPDNYNDYIERIEFALLAYYTNNMDLIDNEKFELQK